MVKSVDFSRCTHKLYFPNVSIKLLLCHAHNSFSSLYALSPNLLLFLICFCCFFFYPILMTVHNSLATVAFQSIVSHGCQRDQLHRCVKTAEPLLRNPDYVVPATLSDVSTHCRSLHSADMKCFLVAFVWRNFNKISLNLTLKNRQWIHRLHQRLRNDLPDER